jgi:hypothetical protein
MTQDKYLISLRFLLGPVTLPIILPTFISFLESTLVSRCSQFDKSIDGLHDVILSIEASITDNAILEQTP